MVVKMNSRREFGLDFIRTACILIVFFGHILNKQLPGSIPAVIDQTLSPGITMSLLGFISAVLLSGQANSDGEFLFRRFTRIYTSLVLTLLFILFIHFLEGKDIFHQHTLFHLLGLSGFITLFAGENHSTIGAGLWFITAILIMYVLFPLIKLLFQHRYRKYHLAFLIVTFTVLDVVTYGTASTFNVFIAFTIGVYLSETNAVERLSKWSFKKSVLVASVTYLLVLLATVHIIPYNLRHYFFALYPIAFVPFALNISSRLPEIIARPVTWFSLISYEFYVLHFYFINNRFYEFFPRTMGLFSHILISFAISTGLAYVFSKAANKLRRLELAYLKDGQTS